jgi:hypothetical protein
MKQKIDSARLMAALDYDPITGIFTWKISTSNRVKVGAIAGTNHSSGYRFVFVDGAAYKAHRLAWLYVHGVWPEADIDHINGIRNDNRIANLRSVTRSINQQNLRSARGDTNTGALGVYKTDKKSKPFKSFIKADGQNKFIGNFKTVNEASAAYLFEKRRLHEGCTI